MKSPKQGDQAMYLENGLVQYTTNVIQTANCDGMELIEISGVSGEATVSPYMETFKVSVCEAISENLCSNSILA